MPFSSQRDADKQRPRVYLAGPAVFFENPLQYADRLKSICSDLGLIGIFPLDAEISLNGKEPEVAAAIIKKANCDLIISCDAVAADISPFRGPGMDAGTAYEIGFAEALGKPVACYTSNTLPYLDRVKAAGVVKAVDGELRDAHGWAVENFKLADNLMIAASMNVYSTFEDAVASLTYHLKTPSHKMQKLRA
jgi:nucleoside 2-deoxyribosyltransferase